MPDEDGEVDLSKEANNYENMTLQELKEIAKEKKIKNISKLSKEDLIKELEDTE